MSYKRMAIKIFAVSFVVLLLYLEDIELKLYFMSVGVIKS